MTHTPKRPHIQDVKAIDYQSGHQIRVVDVRCPFCTGAWGPSDTGEHTIEFVHIEGRWVGWCNGSNRMVEGIFSDAS